MLDLILGRMGFNRINHGASQQHMDDWFFGDESPKTAWRVKTIRIGHFIKGEDPIAFVQNKRPTIAKLIAEFAEAFRSGSVLR
ncbi:hypothetical protein DDZ13_02370 [Coraliomargarita sinensis]|uniref:Uncharacterized protein n=1 Tax=Coraliomargarita sinensis TaxID=2174842 RepID=A0A317ZJD5_9BACT|nr:hypothetical protein DDZ13_02370 [Coraliomargarita sinensis]